MAAPTQPPKVSTISSKSPDHPGIPFRSTSHNYINAQKESPTTVHTEEYSQPMKIPDGRRNSVGENLPSPTESWTPTFTRNQSWNREDLKRQAYVVEELEKKKEGQGSGFTEGGPGTRKV